MSPFVSASTRLIGQVIGSQGVPVQSVDLYSNIQNSRLVNLNIS